MMVPSAYVVAYNQAWKMLCDFPDLEIRSALKQGASDNGIAEGEELKKFVVWAERILLS